MRLVSGLLGFAVLSGCSGGATPPRVPSLAPPASAPLESGKVPPSEETTPPPPASLPDEGGERAPALIRFDLAREQRVIVVGSRGQWFLRCDDEPSSNEPLALVPVSKNGPAETISLAKVLGHSHDGRFVAYERGGEAFVFLAKTSRVLAIPKDSHEERPLAAAFAEDGGRVAFLEKGGARVALYALESDALRLLERFELPLTIFSLEATRTGFVGRWTDEKSLISEENCKHPGFPGHSTGKLASARRERDVVRFGEGSSDLRRAPGFITELRTGDLERLPDGTLGKFSEGRFTPLLDHKCGARLLGGNADTDQLAFVCEEHAIAPREEKKSEKPKKKVRLKFPIVVWDGTKIVPLGIETMKTGVDIPPSPGQRLVSMRIGAKSTLLDVEAAVAVSLEKGSVVATFASEALVRDGLEFTRQSDGRKLLSLDTPFSPFLVAGSSLATTKVWLDFVRPESSVALNDEIPLFLTNGGALLSEIPNETSRTFLLRRSDSP